MYHIVSVSLVVCIPLIGSLLLPAAGAVSKRFRSWLAVILVVVPLGLLLTVLKAYLAGNSFTYSVALPLGFSFGFRADGLGLFMALVSALIGLIILFYSFGYMQHEENQNEFYLFVVLFIGAMMGITLTTDLIFLYIFWEISAICCWRLIGFYREKEHVRRANKALLITVSGSVLMLVGFMLIYSQYGTTDLIKLAGKPIGNAAVMLILCGIFSKSATIPLHSWIADAGIAPSPATALLHAALLVKIGVFAFARLFLTCFSIDGLWHTAIPIIAAVSAIASAGAAIAENDIKRIIAYSTVSQIAFIFLGLSVGSPLAIAGGLLYIMMHGISKAGLFLCAGIVEHNCRTKDIRLMGGLQKTMPKTAVSFLICAFSVMGIPPFGGFFSKYMVISGAFEAGHPWIALVFLLGAVMTVIYLLRAYAKVFLGNVKAEAPKEGTQSMVLSVLVFAGLSIISGLLIYYPSSFVQLIVGKMG